MLSKSTAEKLTAELDAIRAGGLLKAERAIESTQSSTIVVGTKTYLNFCANNYLGLADHPEVIQAAQKAMEQFGNGLASVRFICGTQSIHLKLENTLSRFFQTESSILYAACFDANGGLFEPLLGGEDAVISDALNHASIIDGIRLCKAKRFVYEHLSLASLETKLQKAKAGGAKRILISTDGVFSMDGDIAPISEICTLAEKFDALVHVDDCHGTGFLGTRGRGSVEHSGTLGRVDLITSTFGKALGGAIGGFTTGRKVLIDILRQRSRPYLFSNSLPPAIVAGAIRSLELVDELGSKRHELLTNTLWVREQLTAAGFKIRPGTHPIIPVMIGDANNAQRLAADLMSSGVYVTAFSYPVVPKDQARIRVQISAAHLRSQLSTLVEAFKTSGKRVGVLPS